MAGSNAIELALQPRLGAGLGHPKAAAVRLTEGLPPWGDKANDPTPHQTSKLDGFFHTRPRTFPVHFPAICGLRASVE
jgi:hypothetical protein